jgi:hypothetical protein
VAETKLPRNQEARRLALRQAQQELLTRHQAEKVALHAAQETEGRGFLFRMRSAVADLIGRTLGLRSVLSPLQKMTQLDPRERHRLEHEALLCRQERDKQEIAGKEHLNASVDTRERASFEAAMRKEERLAEARQLMREGLAQRAQELKHTAAQEFYKVTRALGLWKQRTFRENELTETFNDEAEFVQRVDDGGDDDEGSAPEREFTDDSDEGDGDDDGPRHRPGRGRGYGYDRDSD